MMEFINQKMELYIMVFDIKKNVKEKAYKCNKTKIKQKKIIFLNFNFNL